MVNLFAPTRPNPLVFLAPAPANPAIPDQINASCKSLTPTSTAPLAAGIYYSNNSAGIGGHWFLGLMVFPPHKPLMPPHLPSCGYPTSGGGVENPGGPTPRT